MNTDASGNDPENPPDDALADAPSDARKSSRRAFLLAFLVFVTTLLVAASLLLTLGTVAARPEGVAERWLTYVGESTRAGIGDKARDHADSIGPVTLAAPLLGFEGDSGEPAFATVTVGSATVSGDLARVPFRVRQRRDDVREPDVNGTLTLRRTGGDWRVIGLNLTGDTGRSTQIQPSASARPWLLPGALLLVIAVAAACSLLVRAATPSTRR